MYGAFRRPMDAIYHPWVQKLSKDIFQSHPAPSSPAAWDGTILYIFYIYYILYTILSHPAPSSPAVWDGTIFPAPSLPGLQIPPQRSSQNLPDTISGKKDANGQSFLQTIFLKQLKNVIKNCPRCKRSRGCVEIPQKEFCQEPNPLFFAGQPHVDVFYVWCKTSRMVSSTSVSFQCINSCDYFPKNKFVWMTKYVLFETHSDITLTWIVSVTVCRVYIVQRKFVQWKYVLFKAPVGRTSTHELL